MDIEEILLDIDHYFSSVEDPRTRESPHEFRDILLISLCSSLCGMFEWWEMSTFAEAQEDWLKSKLDLSFKSGVPSEFTFERVLSALNPKVFEKCFIHWSSSLRKVKKDDVIAIDGKTSKGSRNAKDVLHCVNAWSTANGIALGQVATAKKSNEIKAIPELLDSLDIKGNTITIDAMGCQKAIAKQIIESKANYLLALKGNQSLLFKHASQDLDDAMDKLKTFKDQSFYQTDIEDAHGRLEFRKCLSIPVNSKDKNYDSIHFWSGIKSLSVIESHRTVKKTGKTSIERRYYISSLEADAEKVLFCSRSHWGIENKLHWVLDVAYKEDASKVRAKNGPRVQSLLRKIALNKVKQNPLKTKRKLSFRRMQKLALFNIQNLEHFLGIS